MKRKFKVTVDGRDYLLSSSESEEYIEKVAKYVDDQITQAHSVSRYSAVDAVTMAAMNLADGLFRERAASESLRIQLKEALDESAKLKREVSDLKRENFRLSQKR